MQYDDEEYCILCNSESDVSKKHITSIFMVEEISKQETSRSNLQAELNFSDLYHRKIVDIMKFNYL
jgi:hypothetical protein